MVGFYDPLLDETEFRQHLLAALQIQVLSRRLCIQRTTGRWCQNSGTDQSRPWKLTTSTHSWAIQKRLTILNRFGYRYAMICIFPTVSLSNRGRLSYISYEHNTKSKGCLCFSPMGSAACAAWPPSLVVLLFPPCPNLINKIVSIENFNIATRITSIHHSGDSGFDRLLIVAKQNFNISGAIYFCWSKFEPWK